MNSKKKVLFFTLPIKKFRVSIICLPDLIITEIYCWKSRVGRMIYDEINLIIFGNNLNRKIHEMWAISIASFCCRLCVEMLTGQQPRNYWAEILAHLVPVTRAVTLSMRSNDGPLKCYRGDLSNIPASDVGSYVNNDINSSHQHYHNCRAPIVRISVWQLIIRDEYFDRIPSPTCWSGTHNIQHHGLTWMGTGD